MKGIDNLTAAYLGGIIDGEGCFTVSTPPGLIPKLSIAQQNRPFLEWLQIIVGGGYITKHNDRIEICNKQLREFLPAVLPYIRIKRSQAELLMELCELKAQFRRGRGTGGVPNYKKNAIRHQEIREEVMALNQRK
jgi:hypothetical protein